MWFKSAEIACVSSTQFAYPQDFLHWHAPKTPYLNLITFEIPFLEQKSTWVVTRNKNGLVYLFKDSALQLG